MSNQAQDHPRAARDPSSESARKSRSLVRAGIGGLIFVGMLLFLLWIPVMKTGEFRIGSDGCFVFTLLSSAIGVSAYCFFRAVKLRLPSKDDGCCQTCGYNLRGNTSGVCPECGAAVDRSESAA